MSPIPTASAVCAFLGAVVMLAAALLFDSPSATVLAAGALLGLAAAFAWTLPLGAQLRTERIEFAWRLVRAEGAGAGVVASVPFELHCQLYNRGQRELAFIELTPVLPDGVRVLSGTEGALLLPAGCCGEFALRVVACAAGRVVAQGFAVAVTGPLGLFVAPLYFPSSLSIRVLPRSASRNVRSQSAALVSDVRTGARAQRLRGTGTELHELREHRAGDPLNTIAWKASARAGKLLVREFEREVQDDLEIVLDVSGTMRGGAPGERKLDHCIELCALVARQAIERGDRVGLITVDGRIVARVREAEGLPHMLAIYEALLHATEVVDDDLTDADDDFVTASVGLYFRKQLGLSLIRAGRWDEASIVSQVERALGDENEAHARAIVASSPAQAALRRFCRLRGIALPYRTSTRHGAKQGGLVAAMRAAAGAGQSPRTVLMVSDLDGMRESATLLRAAGLLKQRRHALAFVLPDAESFVGAPRNRLERDLRHVYGTDERARLGHLQAELRRLGIPLLSLAAPAASIALLDSIANLRRAA